MTGNPLVATAADESVSPWAGIWIAEDIEQIAHGIESGSWIDGTLGVVSAGLDGLALISDPVGALLQYGIAWLIEHVEPLSEALDWLAGDPAAIAAQATTWRNVAAALRADARTFHAAVEADLPDWTGAAATAYRTSASHQAQRLQALATATDATALATEGAGILIGTVRLMVRDAVATVVSRLIVYAGELIATAGLATPLVVEQVTTLCASWAAKIARWLKSLLASLRKLTEAMTRLGRNVDDLGGSSTGGSGSPSGGREPDAPGGAPRPEDPGFDPGTHKGPLGDAFAPGVHDPDGRFQSKEYAIAADLAAEGKMVHPRELDMRQGYESPDAMVRDGPGDGGTVTEFKTLESASSGAVRNNLLKAGSQVDQVGGGDVVIDGRGAGLTEETARSGYNRAAGQAIQQGKPMPDRTRFLLGDGSTMEIQWTQE